jgi:L-alanine-DL-glutamate epimerase-like enolase superfamily enzyme
MPTLTWQRFTLHLRNPFRISYGVSDTRDAFWLRLAGDEGWGEGTIPPYYKVDQSEMVACWQEAAGRNEPWPDDLAAIPAWLGDAGPAPARSALDLAFHDRIGRRRGLPLYQLLGLPRPAPRPTAFTIAIDSAEAMAGMARQVSQYPLLKIKLGSDDDETRIAAIRQARPDARLIIDANAAWSAEEAVGHIRALERFDLELIEQPVDKDDLDGLAHVQAHTRLPIAADESARTLGDVERLAAAGVQVVNLKLMKVGGLGPAVAMARRARELGLRLMLGCMIETSLGITAMAHLAGLAEWLDLDAPLLITNDPFAGAQFDDDATIHLPDRPGIGAVPTALA